jgi:hypothetical protein
MKFNSITSFDNIFKEEPHFQIHQEMLPYIGPDYERNKILLISESHFVPCDKGIPTDDEWYNPKDINKLLLEIEYNTNSREILEKFFNQKKHRLFINFDSALRKTNLSIGIEHVSWYNYFQKPAFNKDSIRPTILDYEIAKRVFEKVLETINPNVIIFTSVKSFNSLLSDLKWNNVEQAYFYKSFNSRIDFVSHPNSAWWNRNSKKYIDRILNQPRTGQQKFIDVINFSTSPK